MFWSTVMITLSVVPLYSHVKPVAPLGNCPVPVSGTPVASGRVVDSADPTVEPLGHWAAAAAAVGVGVGAAVPAADDGGGVLVLDPPQAARVVANINAMSGIQRGLLLVTCPALHLQHRASTALAAGTMTELRPDARGHHTHGTTHRLLVSRRL